MPALVGPVHLNQIGGNAIFTVGDSFSLSPKSGNKTSVGSGVGNTGDFIETQNLFNISNFNDVDLFDQVSGINK